MGRGRRPVDTVPCHGINIGADVTKLWLAWLIRNKNKNNIDKENFNFFEFFSLWFLELSGLKIDNSRTEHMKFLDCCYLKAGKK